jgi:non-ribosomal peptide synthetase component E (peptide arylation enzyme)
MRSQGIWNCDTAPRWLFRYAHATPDKAAVVGPAETLNYGEAFRRAMNLARAFTALGLRKGDVLVIQIPNHRPSQRAHQSRRRQDQPSRRGGNDREAS